MEARRVFLFLYLFLCGTFFPPFFTRAATIIPAETHVTKATEWKKSESPYLVMGQIHVDAGGELTIEPGTVVKMEISKGKINVFGKLTAIGTEKDKIIFTSIRDDENGGDTNNDGNSTAPARGDWQDINLSDSKQIKLKYAKIMYAGGGNADDAIVINGTDNVSVTRSEIKNNRYAGLKIINSLPTIEENIITNNYTGIYFSSSAKTLSIRNNSIRGNMNWGASVLNSNGVPSGHIDARNNWWGNDSGPTHKDNPNGKGDKISDNVLFDPWLGKDTNDGTPDPAIIIPGIMGSWEKDGAWQIDPIFHTYDDLIEAFIAAGYANDGKEMSVFPYEWRDSNIKNAELLHKRIQRIKVDTGRPKVDIVAHSMGGLLARQYIESGDYENDVDQLITLGTPHLGAPKDYVTWEGGVFGPKIKDYIAGKIFGQEAEEEGFDDIFHYVHNRPIKSVEELLPTYNYLYDADDNYALRATYPANYPQNEFLDSLNSPANMQPLKDLEFTKIIGDYKKEQDTISGFNVVNSDDKRLWAHGYPERYWFITGTRGLIRGCGDETVPCYSAKSDQIPSSRLLELNSRHGDIPTDAQQDILEILTGKRPTKMVNEWRMPDAMLIIQMFSPADFQIISPSGDKIGKDLETEEVINEIPGAYYTGFNTDTEFVTIPNPEDGEYQIIAEGTDEGDYEIEVAKITEDEATGETEESSRTITGTTEPEKQEEAKIEIEGNDVKKVEKLTAPDPEKKNAVADSVHTAVYTEVSSSSPENKIAVQENQSKIQKLDTLKNDIRQYFNANQIKKRKVAAEITKKLSKIRVYLKNYATGTKIKKIRIAKTKANQDIAKLTRFINKNSPKYITEEIKANLIEDLNDLGID